MVFLEKMHRSVFGDVISSEKLLGNNHINN